MPKKPKPQKPDKNDIPKNTAIVAIVVILALAWYAYDNPITVGIISFFGLLVAVLATVAIIIWQLKGTLLGALLKLK